MGSNIKNEILVNAIFPFILHDIRKRSSKEEMEIFCELYSKLPSSKSSKWAYLGQRFFSNSRALENLETEQGALQIHRDFCSQFETSCFGCPFIKRYEFFMKNNAFMVFE